jgi:hypothetical protein
MALNRARRIKRTRLTLALSIFTELASAAPQPKVAQLGAWPRSDQVGATLTILNEELVLDCTETGDVLDCSSRSTLQVENPAPTPIKLTLEVGALEAVSLTVDALPIGLERPQGSDNLIGKAELAPIPNHSGLVVFSPHAFRIETNPVNVALAKPATVARHPLMGQYPGPPVSAQVPVLSVAAARVWKEVKRSRLILRYPGTWNSMPTFPACGALPSETGCERTLPSGVREIEWTLASTGADSPPPEREVFLEPRGSYFSNGGFLLGMVWGGGGGCLACAEAFRMRLGYEIGLATWGLLGIAGEVSTDSRTTIIPTLERIRWFPQLIHPFPTISGGFGIPVRVHPELQIGGRIQGSLAWPVASTFSVGVGAMFDVLFTAESAHPEAATMLQIGL